MWRLYYVGRDYLGSITHIADNSGKLVAEYSYDAWGRMRNPVNQNVYTPGSEPELFLGRGYTGHEHLSFFGLVNMNARLYDPVLLWVVVSVVLFLTSRVRMFGRAQILQQAEASFLSRIRRWQEE